MKTIKLISFVLIFSLIASVCYANLRMVGGEMSDGSFSPFQMTHGGAAYIHKSIHRDPDISVHMTRTTGVTDTLASASAKNDQTITVTNGAQWSPGNKIKIVDSANIEYDILKIVSISTNDLTLDRQLDTAHSSGISVVGVTPSMIIDGSTTPVIYSYAPNTGKKIHIHSIHVTIESTVEPSLGLLGGQAAFSNGIHFRVKRTTSRDDTYWIPFRTMNSMVLSGWVYKKEPKTVGTWYSNLLINLELDSNNIITLDDALGESFEIIIQDNNGNLAMEVKLSIHEE